MSTKSSYSLSEVAQVITPTQANTHDGLWRLNGMPGIGEYEYSTAHPHAVRYAGE